MRILILALVLLPRMLLAAETRLPSRQDRALHTSLDPPETKPEGLTLPAEASDKTFRLTSV